MIRILKNVSYGFATKRMIVIMSLRWGFKNVYASHLSTILSPLRGCKASSGRYYGVFCNQ